MYGESGNGAVTVGNYVTAPFFYNNQVGGNYEPERSQRAYF